MNATRTLNDRQKYLLNRLPERYNLPKREHAPDPPAIKKARRLIERFDRREAALNCKHTKRLEALLQKAKEAVYFSSETKALRIVQQVEKMTQRKCEI